MSQWNFSHDLSGAKKETLKLDYTKKKKIESPV